MSSRGPIRTALHLVRTLRGSGVPGGIFRTPELPSRTLRSMGTEAAVTLGASYTDRIESAAGHIRSIFDRLEGEMSVYRPNSAIGEIAKNAGVTPVTVPQDTYRVLELALHFGSLSDGAFDNTSSPLVRLWGFNGAPPPKTFPSDQSVNELLKLIDYRRVTLRHGTAFLSLKGMAVDVGGIAKGYAVDRAYDYCLGAGIHDFLIDFSGNVRTAGRPSRREGWQIGVRNPFDGSQVLGKIALPSGMATATSGGYERFVEIAGERFCHIVDPRSGYPVSDTASVTVLCPDAVTADALSTAFFVVGLKGATELLKKIPSVELLVVPDRYPPPLWLTPGFARVFSPVPELAGSVRVLSVESRPGRHEELGC